MSQIFALRASIATFRRTKKKSSRHFARFSTTRDLARTLLLTRERWRWRRRRRWRVVTRNPRKAAAAATAKSDGARSRLLLPLPLTAARRRAAAARRFDRGARRLALVSQQQRALAQRAHERRACK